MGKGILNRGTQVHKSKVKYNRLAVAKKSDCNPVTKYIEEEKQLNNEGYNTRFSQKQKEQWRSYVSSKLEPVDDQENIRRLRETRVPKKLKIKLKRQASEKGLAGNQVDKYIQKVERRMNRRKSD